jgi:hypothetical protein
MNKVGESCEFCQHIMLIFSPTYLLVVHGVPTRDAFFTFCSKRMSCESNEGTIPLSFSAYLYSSHHLCHQCLRCCLSDRSVVQHLVRFFVCAFCTGWLIVRQFFVAVFFYKSYGKQFAPWDPKRNLNHPSVLVLLGFIRVCYFTSKPDVYFSNQMFSLHTFVFFI